MTSITALASALGIDAEVVIEPRSFSTSTISESAGARLPEVSGDGLTEAAKDANLFARGYDAPASATESRLSSHVNGGSACRLAAIKQLNGSLKTISVSPHVLQVQPIFSETRET